MATHVMAKPQPHAGNGKTMLVAVEPSPLGPAFEFHRRKYVYDQRSETFVKIRCRVDRPLSFYRNWRGLPTEAAVESARLMYGTNRFEMETPKFLEMYKKQLLSPFTIFQVSQPSPHHTFATLYLYNIQYIIHYVTSLSYEVRKFVSLS